MNTRNLKELTSKAFEKIWKTESQKIKYQFGLHLFEYAAGKFYDYNSPILPTSRDKRQEIINSYRKTKNSSSVAKQFHRLSIGYYGVTNLSPKKCNLVSKKALNCSGKTTNDHVIGVTTCSQYVIKIFKDKLTEDLKFTKEEDPFKFINNLDETIDSIQSLCNEWLFDHMWLWAQCKITIQEHHINNLNRVYIGKIENINTIEEEIEYKFHLEHYNNAKEIITIGAFEK